MVLSDNEAGLKYGSTKPLALILALTMTTNMKSSSRSHL